MPPASIFTTVTETTGSDILLRCAGEIDLANIHLLQAPLHASLQEASRSLTVDLREVLYLDSAAMGALLGAAQRLRAHDGRLRLRATPRQVQLFYRLGCQQIFEWLGSADG